jgi:hypothetical protein
MVILEGDQPETRFLMLGSVIVEPEHLHLLAQVNQEKRGVDEEDEYMEVPHSDQNSHISSSHPLQQYRSELLVAYKGDMY